MTLSAPGREAAARLATLADTLVAGLAASAGDPARCGVAEAATVVRRYRDLLETGLRTGDAALALRGANALTTVNKGLCDTIGVMPELEALGLDVTREAIGTAGVLRADVGWLGTDRFP